MITLWHKGKYFDSFYNSLNDPYFMEVSMINLGFDPIDCEWIDYKMNLNGHNPRQFNDENRECKWLSNEIEEGIVIKPGIDPINNLKTRIKNKITEHLIKTLEHQKRILSDYFIKFSDVENLPEPEKDESKQGVLYDDMKQFIPSDKSYVLKKGLRLKKYSGEQQLPLKIDTLKGLANYLLHVEESRKIKWSKSFKEKLNSFIASPQL